MSCNSKEKKKRYVNAAQLSGRAQSKRLLNGTVDVPPYLANIFDPRPRLHQDSLRDRCLFRVSYIHRCQPSGNFQWNIGSRAPFETTAFSRLTQENEERELGFYSGAESCVVTSVRETIYLQGHRSERCDRVVLLTTAHISAHSVTTEVFSSHMSHSCLELLSLTFSFSWTRLVCSKSFGTAPHSSRIFLWTLTSHDALLGISSRFYR